MQCWARRSGRPEPLVVVNIGGVAQVTYIKGDLVLAFDTGPGNAPIDDWMHRHSGRPLTRMAPLPPPRKVNGAALDTMLGNPFFTRAPPNRWTGWISGWKRSRLYRLPMARPP